jgi:hypothetical protein
MAFGRKSFVRYPLAALATLLSLGLFAGGAQSSQPKPVSVYPAPTTPVASEQTTFSFRGLKPGKLGKVRVVGAKTGQVGHTRLNHSDGRGVSIVPKKSFQPGEVVRVSTNRRIRRANNGNFWVRIGKFYGNEDVGGPGLPIPTDGLKSRPDLKPALLNVVTKTDQAAPGMFFYAPRDEGLTITDGAGKVRWNQPTGFGNPGGTNITDFRAQTYNGKPVLTYYKGSQSTTGFSQSGFFEILNDRYNRIARFTPGNGYKADIHELRLTPRDTALVLAYRGVLWDMTSVGGPKEGKVMDNVVQEIDIKTGAVVFEWHALGNVGLKSAEKVIPEDGAVWDYFHVNSAAPDGDSILVSGRSQSTIYRIDRKTARVRWRLRGDGIKPKTNSFKMGPGTSFGYQHDAIRLPNGDISLCDNGVGNGYGPPVNEKSSGLILKLSNTDTGREAKLVKRFNHPDGVSSISQCGMHPQPNGNFVVGWGSVKRFTEFTPDGEVAFDATFNTAGRPSYRAYKSQWVGRPNDRPSISSEADGPGATVWASWNGSTSVASWKVFTGETAGSLTEVGSSPWQDLETEIPVPSVQSKVQVVAYDKDGKKLAESGLTPLGQQSR